jgi:hypothetical protein
MAVLKQCGLILTQCGPEGRVILSECGPEMSDVFWARRFMFWGRYTYRRPLVAPTSLPVFVRWSRPQVEHDHCLFLRSEASALQVVFNQWAFDLG